MGPALRINLTCGKQFWSSEFSVKDNVTIALRTEDLEHRKGRRIKDIYYAPVFIAFGDKNLRTVHPGILRENIPVIRERI
jgi:hypothetical protein